MGWTRFLRRRHWDEERARELASYLEQETDDNIARGLPPDEARHAARRKLGNVTRIREEIYDMNTLALLETVWQDLRYGARLLWRNPTFAVVAILTLALGTGANTAIFQLVDALRLRALPVERPAELAEIRVDSRDQGRTGRFEGARPMLTYPQWRLIRDEQQGFSSLMAWSSRTFDLSAGGEARPVRGLWVTGSFFETLGVGAALGRTLGPSDDTPGCASPGAVLSHGFWAREYGASPSVLERTILLDGHRFDVVGVAPERFFGVEVGQAFDVALPLCSAPIFRGPESMLESRYTWFLASLGRLRPGWSVERATTQLRAVAPRIFADTLPTRYSPETAKAYLSYQLEARPAATGVSSLRGSFATPLWILLGLTGLVLLIACANLANLMLARATTRAREIGVRLAIGASRGRVVRQLLSESLLVAALGTLAGLVVARWMSPFLVALLSTDTSPIHLDLAFDWRIFTFAAVVAGLACLLFGLTPALRATGGRPAASPVLGVRSVTDSRDRAVLRNTLVVVQMALSLVLLVGALLFGLSLRNLLTLDPGFRQDNVVLASLDLRPAAVPPDARRSFFDDLAERVRAIPGVDTAAEAYLAPMSGFFWNERVVVGGQLQPGMVNFNAIGPGYFEALGTRLVAGRDFGPVDTPSSPPVAVVNELFVARYLADGDPIGRTFHTEEVPGGTHPRYQIVGVVADTKYGDLREELPPIVYLAAAQDDDTGERLQLVVHADAGIGRVTPAITRAIREAHPAITVQFRSLRQLVTESLTTERLMAALSGVFGVLAVLIATVGLYGVMSYAVARRRMEIGIRMALGADRGTVVRMVVAAAGRLLALGLGIGLAIAILTGRLATSLLFGLQPWDPAALTLAGAVLAAVAIVASWLPAHRASRIELTAALRED